MLTQKDFKKLDEMIVSRLRHEIKDALFAFGIRFEDHLTRRIEEKIEEKFVTKVEFGQFKEAFWVSQDNVVRKLDKMEAENAARLDNYDRINNRVDSHEKRILKLETRFVA